MAVTIPSNSFKAIITGEVDLNKARSDFQSFKSEIEKPIKLTFDTSGFKVNLNNIQNQLQQQGAIAGKQWAQGFQKNIAGVDTSKALERMVKGVTNKDFKDTFGVTLFEKSALSELGASSSIFKALEKELDSIAKKGMQIQSIRFNEDGTSFTAKAINDMGTLVTLTGRWKNAIEQIDNGKVVGYDEGEWKTSVSYLTDFTTGVKEAQAEARKLAEEVDNITRATSRGDFTGNIATMTKELNSVSDTVSKNLVQKAQDAANEYKQITADITSSVNGTAQNPLQGQDLVDAYKKLEDALKRYRNAMKEVRADTTKMFAAGENIRAANDVEGWAKKNSRALKQYGTQLEQLAQQMRGAKSWGELNKLKNDFKNLKSEINAVGLGGLTIGDQIKKAFVHIGEFTGIYAITSQIRQLPEEMVREVIKIDTAMTELRKVSTASASEISDYFDAATESASKFGQTIDEVINSTASWTRLGYDLDDASILTDVTAELAQVGSGLTVDTATEGLQATIRGFSMAADEAKRVGDMINYIADTEPIDAIGIINGLERSSSAMAEANNSLEETIGLITASTSVTQDATSAGTAWRTISMRIRGKNLCLHTGKVRVRCCA